MDDESAGIEAARALGREQALRASDAIIEISADAIITIDEAQRIIRYNNGAEEIFGYTHSEILGRTIDVLIPARFRPNHPSQIRGFAASPVAARRMGERRQISGLRKSGEEFPAEASISKTRIGEEWVYTVALRDVTDRVRVERGQQFLAQASALLSRTLDAEQTIESIATLSIPLLGDWCVVFLQNPDGSFRRALAVHTDPEREIDMKALTAIPFAPAPSHVLMPCLTQGASLILPRFDEAAQRAWADNEVHYQLLRRIDPVSLIAVPLRARDTMSGAICFFFDSPSKRIHQQDDVVLAEELARRAGIALENASLYAIAQAAVGARDDVLAVVSHDLGNPLAAIRLSSTMLRRMLERDASIDPEALHQVDNIRISVLQMERLIKDLLDIKRIEAGFLSLELERISVTGLLGELLDTYMPLAEARGIDFRIEADIPVDISADHERIMQIFSNLIGNALKFTSAGQCIVVSYRVVNAWVEFSIADTGPGMPAEHLPHIFDRFWQARRTGRQGIGLGLAIAKGIADAHGGTIRVTSELGTGTTFTFSVPLASP